MSSKKKENTKPLKVVKGSGYADIYRKAQEEGKTTQVSYAIYEWQEEGQVLIGRLESFETVLSKDIGGSYDGEVNVYKFDTDEGKVSCVCGAVVDRVINQGDYVGSIMALEYRGKRSIKDNKECNLFNVEIISESKQDGKKF